MNYDEFCRYCSQQEESYDARTEMFDNLKQLMGKHKHEFQMLSLKDEIVDAFNKRKQLQQKEEIAEKFKQRRIRWIDEQIQQAKRDCQDIANRIESVRKRIEIHGAKIEEAKRTFFKPLTFPSSSN